MSYLVCHGSDAGFAGVGLRMLLFSPPYPPNASYPPSPEIVDISRP